MPLIAVFTLIAATGAFAHNPNGKADPMNASLEQKARNSSRAFCNR